MSVGSVILKTVRLVAFSSIEFSAPAFAQAKEITDVLGRKVEVTDNVQRIVLGESRLSHLVALLDRDNPFQRIVGWQNDLRKLDPHTFEAFTKKFPAVADIPLLGQASEVSVNVESI